MPRNTVLRAIDEWCGECESGVYIVEEFEEQEGFEEKARRVWVIALSCGHQIVQYIRGRTRQREE